MLTIVNAIANSAWADPDGDEGGGGGWEGGLNPPSTITMLKVSLAILVQIP